MDDFAPDNLLTSDDQQQYPLKAFFLELFKVLIIGAFAVVAIRYFIFKPFVVKGASMEPNFHEGEYLIIDELSYRIKEPHRGDVVVLRHNGDPRDFFLKRVIGLPGERVVVQSGRVKIFNDEQPNGEYLNESVYLSPAVLTIGDKDVTLKDDEYFVLGDNRMASLDSRRIGPVNRRDLIGRALIRGWPLERIDFLVHDFYPDN